MKSDTNPKVEKLYRELLLSKSNEERLIMGCSMFNTAKKIVKASILNENPEITEDNLKKEIFIRFYGEEIDYNRLLNI